MTAWVVRAGASGERDSWALANGLAGGGFHEIDSMEPMTSRDDIHGDETDG